jgi:small multidrug resistance pump
MISNFAAWSLLGVSVISEVVGTVALKQSAGFSKAVPAILAGSCYVLAVWLMAIAMKRIEMGTTYAVWAASGTALTAVVGMAVYDEDASPLKLLGLVLVVVGVAVLNLGTTDTGNA